MFLLATSRMPSLDVLADLLDESCLRDANLQDMVHVWLPFIKTTNRSYPIDLKDPIPSILRNRASTWVVQGFATHKHKLVVWRALPLPFNSAAFSSCLYLASGMASNTFPSPLSITGFEGAVDNLSDFSWKVRKWALHILQELNMTLDTATPNFPSELGIPPIEWNNLGCVHNHRRCYDKWVMLSSSSAPQCPTWRFP